MKRVLYGVGSVVAMALIYQTWACGPFLPVELLSGNEVFILALPRTLFAFDLERMARPEAKVYGFTNSIEDDYSTLRITGSNDILSPPHRNGWENTVGKDTVDLRDALAQTGTVPAQIESLSLQYEEMRRQMKPVLGEYEREPSIYHDRGTAKEPYNLSAHAELINQLPQEFVLYAQGAASYRANRFAEAMQRWQEILALPPDQRQYRSTWAAYMLGKASLIKDATTNSSGMSHYPIRDATTAIVFFQQTQSLAKDGFKDTLNLAKDSEGWIAHAEMVRGNDKEALHRYYRLGKESEDSDWVSLNLLCERIFGKGDIDPSLLQDELCRKILTAWTMSSKTNAYNKWLQLLEQAAIAVTPDEADRLAWLAYRNSDFDKARKWLAQSETHIPEGQWVQAKLLMREGKIKEASDIIGSLIPVFAEKANTDLHGELGVMHLGREEYLEALDSFLRVTFSDDVAYTENQDFPRYNDFWVDAAYLAEYVIDLDDLENYTKTYNGSRRDDLRQLLARRLVRQNQRPKAREYFPSALQTVLDQYEAALSAAENPKKPKAARSKSYFDAAEILRNQGMQLMGTETDPDWCQHDGVFDFWGPSESRRNEIQTQENIYPNLQHKLETIFGPEYWNRLSQLPPALKICLFSSPDERERTKANAPTPDKRFHYRYLAADLMWKCAQLLPDNDPLLAKALYYGGDYVRKRDPAAADRFYKALVRRCKNLPIGQEADRLRWFPDSFDGEKSPDDEEESAE